MAEDNLGPSSFETDAMAWEEINAISQKKICLGSKNLSSFIRNLAHLHVTEKGDDKTNIIDQGAPRTYYFNKDIINDDIIQNINKINNKNENKNNKDENEDNKDENKDNKDIIYNFIYNQNNSNLDYFKILEKYAKKHYTLNGKNEKRQYKFNLPFNFKPLPITP